MSSGIHCRWIKFNKPRREGEAASKQYLSYYSYLLIKHTHSFTLSRALASLAVRDHLAAAGPRPACRLAAASGPGGVLRRGGVDRARVECVLMTIRECPFANPGCWPCLFVFYNELSAQYFDCPLRGPRSLADSGALGPVLFLGSVYRIDPGCYLLVYLLV